VNCTLSSPYLLQVPILGVRPFVQELLSINYLKIRNTRPPVNSAAVGIGSGHSHFSVANIRACLRKKKLQPPLSTR
jgi:hypothetical protein